MVCAMRVCPETQFFQTALLSPVATPHLFAVTMATAIASL